MFKRIGLFIITNIAIIAVFSTILYLIEIIFGVKITGSSENLVSLAIYALIFGMLGSVFSLFTSKWMAKKLYSVQIISQDDYSRIGAKEKLVWDTVKNISENNGISIPEVGFYNAADANAFATGATKNSSLVAVSSGLLQNMTNDEIEAVVAHEMGHILNGDMVTMTLLQGILNAFVIFLSRIVADFITSTILRNSQNSEENSGEQGVSGSIISGIIYILLQIVFGILASLIVMAFSRYREFRADEASARFVGKAKMIAALRALERIYDLAPENNTEMATMQISTKGGFMKLFSSHPDLDKRIENLENQNI